MDKKLLRKIAAVKTRAGKVEAAVDALGAALVDLENHVEQLAAETAK